VNPSNEWEVFTSGKSKARFSGPIISIYISGRFGVNKSARAYLGDFVLLLFNEKKRQIGFRPVDAETEGAYPVREQAGATSYLITGMAFLKYYDLNPIAIKGSYKLTEQEGMLVLQLPVE
jgi:hypothetical protein